MQSVARTTRILGVVAVFAAAQAGRAAWNDNDVVLGFNNGTGGSPNDYIINLGQASSVGIGGSSIVNLSSGFGFSYSTFSSTYTGLSSGVSMGVIGGNTAQNIFYATSLRSSLGPANVAGSSAPLAGHVNSSILGNGAIDTASMVEADGMNEGTSILTPPSGGDSYYNWVLNGQNLAHGSVAEDTGINPNASTAGTVIYEDLWRDVNGANNNQFSYLGFFTLDSGGQTLTFTPSAVPEPGAWQILAGAGIIAFWLRRQFSSRHA